MQQRGGSAGWLHCGQYCTGVLFGRRDNTNMTFILLLLQHSYHQGAIFPVCEACRVFRAVLTQSLLSHIALIVTNSGSLRSYSFTTYPVHAENEHIFLFLKLSVSFCHFPSTAILLYCYTLQIFLKL